MIVLLINIKINIVVIAKTIIHVVTHTILCLLVINNGETTVGTCKANKFEPKMTPKYRNILFWRLCLSSF